MIKSIVTPIALPIQSGDDRDDGIVEEIIRCLTEPTPRSFFLFAGAGSGKTHTLKEVLLRLTGRIVGHATGMSFAQRLIREGRQLAVITYTKNAAEEIEGRLESNPLVVVSTIHSFCWRLVESFDNDIRAALLAELDQRILKRESERPGELTEKGKLRRKSDLDRMLERWNEDLDRLREEQVDVRSVDHFTYSPDKERSGRGVLTHAQVLQVAAWLLANRPTLCRIVIDKYPVIFIDESQDTNKQVLHALLTLEQNTPLLLGLIGDHRQRIYLDGEQALPTVIPKDWERPVLKLNRRCPHRVVDLINAVWLAEVEGRTEVPTGGKQYALSTRPIGAVRLYIGEEIATEADKAAAERWCAEDMARQVSDSGWSDHESGYRLLVLEHQLAADRGGFGELYRCLHRYDPNRAKEGKISTLNLFQNLFLPLFEAVQSDGAIDTRREREVLAAHARELAADYLANLNGFEQRAAFQRVRESARKLRSLWDGGDPTLSELLRCAVDANLILVDRTLRQALETPPPVGKLTNKSPELEILAAVLQQPWSQYCSYRRYVDGLLAHGTHQGVKGSEFKRVLVVIDDVAAGGHTFAYEKVFGAKPLSDGDRGKEEEGKESTVDRTLRLLYVTCSRARESLAVVLWTSSPMAVRERVLELGWFRKEEILPVFTGPSAPSQQKAPKDPPPTPHN